MSGYTEHTLEETQALGGGARFIQKPFTAVALASKVREVPEAGMATNQIRRAPFSDRSIYAVIGKSALFPMSPM